MWSQTGARVDASTPESPASPARADGVRAVLVPLALLGAAVVLLVGPWEPSRLVEPAAPAPAWATNPAPVYQPRFEPRLTVGEFEYRCSDCHKLFDSPPETTRQLTQHREIEHEHGLNTRCFNCHHRENRNAFVDDAGGEIPYDRPQTLCARCHGPVFRDWENGVHGRSNGYWDRLAGPVKRLRCIQCHDPHRPPFPAMRPAPAPRTLRMGQPAAPPRERPDNPLRVYRRETVRPATNPEPEKQL